MTQTIIDKFSEGSLNRRAGSTSLNFHKSPFNSNNVDRISERYFNKSQLTSQMQATVQSSALGFTAGKATFVSHESQRPQAKSVAGTNNDNLLKNGEVKQICEQYNLTRKEVYDIRSQFTSMCFLSREGKQEGGRVSQMSRPGTRRSEHVGEGRLN